MQRCLEEEQKRKSNTVSSLIILICYVVTTGTIELFYLVFWECEDSVSIHPLSEIISPDKELHAVGDVCMVKFKNGDFEGKIASYGMNTYSYS